MSIWDNIKKIGPYGSDFYDEDYNDEDEEFAEEAPAPRASRRSETIKAETAPVAERSESGSFSGKVVNMNAGKASMVLFHPSNFNEATRGADDLRSKKAVIVNLENVDPSVARRVVDFMSGCAYALNGKVKKIAVSTYLFCPSSMDVDGEFETLQTEAEN